MRFRSMKNMHVTCCLATLSTQVFFIRRVNWSSVKRVKCLDAILTPASIHLTRQN